MPRADMPRDPVRATTNNTSATAATSSRRGPAGAASRLVRTRCNLAVLAAWGVLGAFTATDHALAQTRTAALPANTVPVLRGSVDPRLATIGASATSTGTKLTVTQVDPKLILNWQQFNIASGSKVEFVQPSSTASVLNRIHDANPSIIQGQIQANGQVFLLNQNGILFDRGSQIDVNTLVASTLNIADSVFQRGLTSGDLFAPAAQGGYDANGLTIAGAKTAAIVLGGGPTDAAAPRITAATGGSVVLIAPVIDNQTGVISAPDGQVMLAAGRSVYLGFSTVNDPAMRGMLVEVSAGTEAVNLSSLINNAGNLSADRGNITLAGLAINHSGRISASTAMLTNGSVWLQARDQGRTRRGNVTLAAGSLIETPLDLSDPTTLRNSDSYDPYRAVVKIEGARIVHEGSIVAPSGKVSLDAQDDPASAARTVDPEKARIYLAPGSLIDASGAWSDADGASKLLTFKVTSNELKDSPDQKTGLLRGATVTVDLEAGSSLLDLSGFQQNQARSLAQKAGGGGSVALSSTGDLIQRGDARIDVSGGGVNYGATTLATSKLLGADGKTYDIATAPEALSYLQIANQDTEASAKWGSSQTFQTALAEAGDFRAAHVQGQDGGAITVRMGAGATGLVLDGTLAATATAGSHQLADMPHAGSLTLGFGDPNRTTQDFGIGDVSFRSGALASLPAGFGPGSALDPVLGRQLDLSTSLFDPGASVGTDRWVTPGFGSISISANGRISLAEGLTLQGPAGGVLNLQANQIDIGGRIALPSGTLNLGGVATVGTPASPFSAQGLHLASTASIDAQGSWTNLLLAPDGTLRPGGDSAGSYADGGSISLGGAVLRLDSGSVVDVSAGGAVSRRGVASGGKGGNISLTAESGLEPAPLSLGASLRGQGFSGGGTFSLSSAGSVRIGAGTDPAYGLNIDSDFFSQGGFQKYSLTSERDLLVASGTVLAPRQLSLRLLNTRALALASGGLAASAAEFVTLPDDLRKTTSLALTSNGRLTLAEGSAIRADAGAAISLAGRFGVALGGEVSTAGGSIAVSVAAPDQQATTPVLDVGAHARLSTRGGFIAKPNTQGLLLGSLSSGGSINLNASKADIVLHQGALIDVSGASQSVDLASQIGSDSAYQRSVQTSNAGTVAITGNDHITLGATLLGQAQGTAAGGSFVLIATQRGDFVDPTSARRIVVSPSGAAAAALGGYKDIALSSDALTNGGFDKLRLKSEGQIHFAESAVLRYGRGITLDTPLLQVGNGVNVLLLGSQVSLANTFGLRVRSDPNDPSNPTTRVDASLPSARQASSVGTGTFSAFADTLDLFGNITIGGTSRQSLHAVHDLRLSGRADSAAAQAGNSLLHGELVAAGNFDLQAAQIYPTTASSFDILVADGLSRTPIVDGRIDITRSAGERGDIYSAGGRLALGADHIAHNGVLAAPIGTLVLNAGKTLELGADSVTSVSANGLTIPYGETQAGVTWTYGATGVAAPDSGLSTPPDKRISLAGPSVDVKAGASIDVSGGGDLVAVEFVPGSGGSKDVLIQPNTYAILPAAHLSSAPIDPDIALKQNLGFGADGAVYNSIRIAAGGPLPAGDYVLLPGYYGLLPGGYMVQIVNNSTYTGLRPGQTVAQPNGLTVVQGTLTAAGTAVQASASVGVIALDQAHIQQRSDYTLTKSDFFAELAARNRTATPSLPGDGGALAIAATQRLVLDGDLLARKTGAGASSATVDISASRIALVDQVGRSDIAADYLQIDAASLSRLDASLLVGGTRTQVSGQTQLATAASNIIVANSAATTLSAPELLLAATDLIDVRGGSSIAASASGGADAHDLTLSGASADQGALLRISSAGPVAIKRPGRNGVAAAGTLQISAGAALSTGNSLQLDATRNTVSNGKLDIAAGGALSLASGTVSLGDVGDNFASDGLVLSNLQLAGFNTLGSLTIKSYGGIDLYGATTLGSDKLARLVLDSGGLTGRAGRAGTTGAQATLQAGAVDLINSSGARVTLTSTSAAAGALTIKATDITLGAGDKTISGYGAVQLQAARHLLASGTGTLEANAALTLDAGLIRSSSGADQNWSAAGQAVSFATQAAAPLSATQLADALAASADALGSRLSISGATLNGDARIVMKSGAIALTATGSGAGEGVLLGSKSVLDASGASRDFQGTVMVADGGAVSLTAAGQVALAAGALVDVSAAHFKDAAGKDQRHGRAGSLNLRAQTLNLAGTLAGQAATPEDSGQAHIDVDRLDAATATQASGLHTLGASLDAGSFTALRDLRLRQGDLVLGSGDTVQAHTIVLSADAGNIVLDKQARLDASSTLGGGSVALYGRGLTLAAGSVIDASATSTAVDAPGQPATPATPGTPATPATVAPYAHGGTVTLVAADTLDFARGAVIDVRSGTKGDAGSVLLRAPRTATGASSTGLNATLAGQVLSQRRGTSAPAQVVVEGNQVYTTTGTTLGQAQFASYAADNQRWMAGLDRPTLTASLTGDDSQALANVHLRPAVEVRAAGDLALVENWDLTGAGWRIASPGAATPEAGSLVLRAGGDLRLTRAWLGNPDTNLVAGPTWNIALTSGADLGATDASRTRSTGELAAQSAVGTAGQGDLVLDSVRDPAANLQIESAASIRTGTGNIHLSAGRDFRITAAISPDFGHFDTVDPFDPFSAPLIGVVTTSGEAAITTPVPGLFEPDRFTQHGGAIRIDAQRDAVGAGNEWLTEWFRSIGSTDRVVGNAKRFGSGAWWSYRPNFFDGVATFGGGDITIAAGHNVDGLSAYAATSARGVDAGSTFALQTWGGGDLHVTAGQDLISGQYLIAQGQGELRAGGSIRSKTIEQVVDGQVKELATQVFVMGAASDPALAGASMVVDAGQGVALASIDNPGALPIYNSSVLNFPKPVSFNADTHLNVLSYDASSQVAVSARSGDLRVGNRPGAWWALSPFEIGPDDSASGNDAALLPPQVAMTAFGGSIVNMGSGNQILYTSDTSRLQLLASQDIVAPRYIVSDADPASLAFNTLKQDQQNVYQDLLITSAATPNRVVNNLVDARFVDEVVALQGSIVSPSLRLPAVSRVWAGQDISNPNLQLQNLKGGDETQVVADQGSFFGPRTAWGISGPGSLRLQAGQDIDLGTVSFKSLGNQLNASLADASGARLVIIAGVSGAVDLTRLNASTTLPADPTSTGLLFDALIGAGNGKDAAAADAAVAALLDGLKINGGDINSFRTSIQSNAGGDIVLFAPRGNITVGLTTPEADKAIGVITNAGGAIRSYLNGNFDINQGKVLTAQGGDIAIYTSQGSIDAGRGAKTSVTTPPPVRRALTDAQGNFIGFEYTLPVAVAGSGIQTVTSKPGGPSSVAPPAGSIFLFAPAGTIDAGEAGINSGAGIFLAALTVLNADNIKSVGPSVGVPQVVVGSVAASLASSGTTTAAGSSKDAEAATQAAAGAAKAAAATAFKPAILTVEVMGFGEKNCKETDRDCFAK